MGLIEEFQAIILPVIVFFVICNVVGFFGNLLVLYVFSVRYRRNRYRLLVLVLSAVDMTACCTAVPMETISAWLWFNAPSKLLCKLRYFFVIFMASSAHYMLFVTAVYKYRRICKPFGKQVTVRIIIILCVIGEIFALMYGTAAAILFDVSSSTITINNITGVVSICGVDKAYRGTEFPAIFRHSISVYTLLLVATIALYTLVARTTILHVRRMRRAPKTSSKAPKSETVSTGESNNSQSFNQDLEQTEDTCIDSTINSSEVIAEKSTQSKTVSKSSCRRSKLSANQIRTVFIMTIISGVFSVTFFLAMSLGYVFALRKFSDYSSLEELVLLYAIYRLLFINFALNPVVYFVLDRQFREEAVKVFNIFRK